MFDPLGIRKLNKRYYSRKGQINQVKAANNFSGCYIDPEKVQFYKDYIINQKLIHRGEIHDDDPAIQKEHIVLDESVTLQDIYDMFPQNAVKIKADIVCKTQLNGTIRFNGWDERVCFVSGLIPNSFFNENWQMNGLTFVKALAIPDHATGAHEGERLLIQNYVASKLEIAWKTNDDFVARIDDGDVTTLIAPSSPTINDQKIYTNCRNFDNKTSDDGQDTFTYTYSNSQPGYRLHVDWERSNYVNITNWNYHDSVIGAWIGYYNTYEDGGSNFRDISILQDVTIDLYYYTYET